MPGKGNTMNQPSQSEKTYRVSCTISSCSYEYGDSITVSCNPEDAPEFGLHELAKNYAADSEDYEEVQKIVTDLKLEGLAWIGDRAITKVLIEEIVPITVIVRGGVIQDIQNIPDDITVRVIDYDADGKSEEDVDRDENGEYCTISTWE